MDILLAVSTQKRVTTRQISEMCEEPLNRTNARVTELEADGVISPVREDGEVTLVWEDSLVVVAAIRPAIVKQMAKAAIEHLAPQPQPQAHITTDQIAQALGVKPSPSFLNNAGIGRTCLRDLDLHNHYERQPDGSTKFSLVGALVVGLCHSRKVAFTDALHHLKVQAEAPRLQQATNPKLDGLHEEL